MEAALQRFYNVDLRDLYRPGSGLTYRRVLTLIQQLPSPWTIEAHLLDDIRRQLAASKENPRPKPSPGRFRKPPRTHSPERQKKLRDARRRARERQRLIDSGQFPSGT